MVMYRNSLAGVNEFGLNDGNNYLFNDMHIRVSDLEGVERDALIEQAMALLEVANNVASAYALDNENLFVSFNNGDNSIVFVNGAMDEIRMVVNEQYEVILDAFFDVGGEIRVEHFCGVDGSGFGAIGVALMGNFLANQG